MSGGGSRVRFQSRVVVQRRERAFWRVEFGGGGGDAKYPRASRVGFERATIHTFSSHHRKERGTPLEIARVPVGAAHGLSPPRLRLGASVRASRESESRREVAARGRHLRGGARSKVRRFIFRRFVSFARGGIVRGELEAPRERVGGADPLAGVGERAAETVVRLGPVRVDGDGARGVAKRGVDVAEGEVGGAAVGVERAVVGGAGDGLRVQARGFAMETGGEGAIARETRLVDGVRDERGGELGERRAGLSLDRGGKLGGEVRPER